MCTRICSRFINASLYALAFISVLCNILLFFPGWSTEYAWDGNLTEEVRYMGGLIGGGLMVFASTLFIHLTGKQGCCGNCFGGFLSIARIAGALYSFVVAMLGLVKGPYCKVGLIWTTPFKHSYLIYLMTPGIWGLCTAPKNVVEFNVRLFSTLVVTSVLQLILCGSQMIIGRFCCL